MEQKKKMINEKMYSGNNTVSKEREVPWIIALTLFFVVSMNVHWHSSYILWYGSLIVLVLSYNLVFVGSFQIKNYSFFVWFVSFFFLGVFSLLWALSFDVTFDVLKNLAVYGVVLFTIQLSLQRGFKISTALKCFLFATVINSIYIILKIDTAQIGKVQVGVDLISGWNGNAIGFMAMEGALIAYYLLGQTKRKLEKLVYLISILFLGFLTIITGSRTAFIVLIASFVIYFWGSNPKKLIRNVFITFALLIVMLLLIMSVESFYNVLGSRLEGLLAMFKGETAADTSSLTRNEFIENGKKWFAENPILGIGLNNYKVLNGPATGLFTYAHNNFIEIAVDLGVIGLIIYYSVYVYLIFALIKTFKYSKINLYLLVALVASLISQYGTVSYYGLYQNFLLMLCFFVVGKANFAKQNREEGYEEKN